MNSVNKLKVYVCGSLRAEVVEHVDKILKDYSQFDIDFFRPYGTDTSELMNTVVEDVEKIENCDEIWVMGQWGRDSSWEIGYAMALKKRVIFFVDETNEKLLESDWMWRIGFRKNEHNLQLMKKFPDDQWYKPYKFTGAQ